MELTEEQKWICEKIVNDEKNLIIVATAGAGKTETLRQAAELYIQRYGGQVLILTYNKALEESCKARILERKLDNHVSCLTYHAAALQFFLKKEGRSDFGDSLIHDALKKKRPHDVFKAYFRDLKLVLVDEAQDLTDSLADFVKHLLSCLKKKPLLSLCGDPFQRIYGFRRTTLKYMMEPEQHFGQLVANGGKFETARLSICFRISHEMADYINTYHHPKYLAAKMPQEQWDGMKDAVLSWWGEGIRANPRRGKSECVTHVVSDWSGQKAAEIVHPLYEQYDIHQITILVYSGKSEKSPIWKFINHLTNLARPKKVNWATFFESGNRNQEETTCSNGKREASTIHRWKGMENDVIVVFIDGFAETRTNDLFELFCTFYVGLTRARKKLVVIQNSAKAFCTRELALEDSVHVETKQVKQKEKMQILTPKQLAAKLAGRYQQRGLKIEDIFGYVPFDTFLDQEALETVVTHQDVEVKMKNVLTPEIYLIQCEDQLTRDNVLPLYNTALQLAIQFSLEPDRKTLPKPETLFPNAAGMNDNVSELQEIYRFLSQSFQIRDAKTRALNWVLLVKVANAYRTLATGLICKWRQLHLKQYEKWVPTTFLQNLLNTCLQLLGQHGVQPGSKLEFHKRVSFPVMMHGIQIDLCGQTFLETQSGLLYMAFQQSVVSDTQCSIAYATSCLQYLNPSVAPCKPTYVISPQQGALFQVKRKLDSVDAADFNNRFLLNAVARKLNVDPSSLQSAPSRIGKASPIYNSNRFPSSSSKKRKEPMYELEGYPTIESFFKKPRSKGVAALT